MKKIILVIVLIVIVLSGVVLIKNKSSELKNAPTAKMPLFNVNVVNVEEKTINEKSSFLAKLESQNAPQITTKISGFIKALYVKENQVVKKGDLLVEIDSSELQESLIQLENSIKSMEFSIQSVEVNVLSLQNDLKSTEHKLFRDKILFESGGLSKESYENSQVQTQLKKAKLDSTLKSIKAKKYELKAIRNSYLSKKESLKYYNIKAPIDAIVDRVILKVGDMASATKPILTLLDKKQKLTFSFAQNNIKKGLEVSIDKTINAKITKILKSSEMYLSVAQIDLDATLNYPVGSLVNIEVITKNVRGFALPINTILHKKDANYVVIYEGGVFEFKKINILAQNDEYVIISENISQMIALASESKLSILPSSSNYKIVEK
ncbi:MAG: multidrug efflux pump subunit AcrA (membrane-fusion protein) [Sulfurimonas sp.]|jgi:multidrug efflux pump subunit AcrA (membrane-fusion protein)